MNTTHISEFQEILDQTNSKTEELAVRMSESLLNDDFGISANALKPMAELFEHIFETPKNDHLPTALQTLLNYIEIQDDRAYIEE